MSNSTDLQHYLRIDDRQQVRLMDVMARYKRLYTEPEQCMPMLIAEIPVDQPEWQERLADPRVMLRAELDALRPHLAVEDDRLPTVRVQFGTAQVAAGFACEAGIPTNNLPTVLHKIDDIRALAKPALTAGWYGRLQEWTQLWQSMLPEGVIIQHPDIQSPCNNAHLIRGNDIFLDFYDDPAALGALLDLVTDYMLELVPWLKCMISTDREWFADWGMLWNGAARLSNCSMQMISAELYREYVLPRDRRLLAGIGGGRIHYCGTAGDCIRDFCRIPELSGLYVDLHHHDLWALAEMLPPQVVLSSAISSEMPAYRRLLAGDWPGKRNLIVHVLASYVEDGRDRLNMIRRSIPYEEG